MEVVLRSASRLVGYRLLDILRKPVSPSMVVPRPPSIPCSILLIFAIAINFQVFFTATSVIFW